MARVARLLLALTNCWTVIGDILYRGQLGLVHKKQLLIVYLLKLELHLTK